MYILLYQKLNCGQLSAKLELNTKSVYIILLETA